MEKNRPLGWTTLEEAKRLVKASLDPNTADMLFENHYGETIVTVKPWTTKGRSIGAHIFPCWSLGELEKLIPDEIKVNDVWFYFFCSYNGNRKWCASYVDENLKRLVRFNMFSSQIEMFHEIVLFLLENNHIKKSE